MEISASKVLTEVKFPPLYQSLIVLALAKDVEDGAEAAVDCYVHDVANLQEFQFESEVEVCPSICISIKSYLRKKVRIIKIIDNKKT